MTLTDIYLDDGAALKVDTEKCILYVYSTSIKYDPVAYLKFMDYLISFWRLAEKENKKYHIVLDLSQSSAAIMPLEFYTTLIKTLNSLEKTLDKHLHSTGILVSKGALTGSIIRIMLTMYKPNRPIKSLNNMEEIYSFFCENKLEA